MKKCWLALLLAAVSALAAADTWRFAAIGDVPYSERERTELPKMLDAIAGGKPAFIAHVGDFKGGTERCDDALFEQRFKLFDDSPVPFVFVPGDNEWTDCQRVTAGAYDPAERLDKLRSLFWAHRQTLGAKRFPLSRQSGDYPEHTRFRLGPVLVVTLNLPGGNNNWGPLPWPGAEHQARNDAVLKWVKTSFALARRRKLDGIVLLFQADPGFKHFSQGLGHRGYRQFLEALRDETLRFPGQVLAVHGDSHINRVDRPLRDRTGRVIANFTRLETFGYPLMGWSEVVIDDEAPQLFRIDNHPWK